MKIVQFFLYAILDIITLLKHCTFSITFSSSICGCCCCFHTTVIYSSPDNVTICRLLEKGDKPILNVLSGWIQRHIKSFFYWKKKRHQPANNDHNHICFTIKQNDSIPMSTLLAQPVMPLKLYLNSQPKIMVSWHFISCRKIPTCIY